MGNLKNQEDRVIARRCNNPAPPELSESNDGGIHHRRLDLMGDELEDEVAQWVLEEPICVAQSCFVRDRSDKQ